MPRTARLGGSGAGRRGPRKRTPGARGAAPSEGCRAQRAPAGAARGAGDPASERRGLGAQPQLEEAASYAVKTAMTVQQTAARAAASEAWGICVLTWSIRSQPVQTELRTVVSEIGEHWSP